MTPEFWAIPKQQPGDSDARADSVLKSSISEEAQALVASWCAKPADRIDKKPIPRSGGVTYAVDRLREMAALSGRPELAVTDKPVAEFEEWHRRRMLMRKLRSISDHQREEMAKFKPGDAQIAREWGEFVLLQIANEGRDIEVFNAARQAQDQRRKLDLDEAGAKTKAEQKNRALDQKDEDLKIARIKLRRDSLELFIEWSEKQEARDIMGSSLSHAEKTERLGRAMFGEDWDS